MKQPFDPNGVGINNGNIFGFPYTISEAEIIILPVPWEVTTSYGGGTSYAPQAILAASPQLDFFDPYIENAWQTPIAMAHIPNEIQDKSDLYREKAIDYITKLEEGELPQSNKKMLQLQTEINQACEELKQWVKSKAQALLASGKTVGLLGGDHSTPLGYLEALATLYDGFGILQIDAHADLRPNYEGFSCSHASIMHNALKIAQVKKIIQLGIRDICPDEVKTIDQSTGRIKTFFDWDIKREQYEGKKWQQQCKEIIAELPEKIYISFDIDGLDPKLCPNTGTPVAGGLELEEIAYLFYLLSQSGKKIIGFDLCEVSPGNDEWDANVGARMLYKLVNLTAKCK